MTAPSSGSPKVGDFVSTDDPLARIYPPTANISEATINGLVAFGPERTMEQAPGFAFRIMVDIGARALSPAINDPTTAVLATDQIHRLPLCGFQEHRYRTHSRSRRQAPPHLSDTGLERHRRSLP
jgi:uncharacterized membrane protein